ncbi:MAG: thiamine diphosphokinase [Candidatus Thermoplasmatota archaeon]|nr:thiamine diphosphokinase [Candidatus Thermoplasmatota archaeon]
MRALLWCNGQQPSEAVVGGLLDRAVCFGVDGGADRAAEAGYEVEQVLGDLDSADLHRWRGQTHELADQSSSDLAKSLSLLIERGYTEIDVVGSNGGSTSHFLGSWAALCEAPPGAAIRLHHEDSVTHRVHPKEDGFEFAVSAGGEFSVFALTPCSSVHLHGARWELDGAPMSLSTVGLHNVGSGESVRIRADGILVVIVPRD